MEALADHQCVYIFSGSAKASIPHDLTILLNQLIKPSTLAEIQHAVRENARVHVRGAGTKTGLHADTSAAVLDLSALRGVIDYQPQEFVISAYAGTPVAEIEALLAQQGQYLPFDPLLSARGATLGGTVAANANGSGRFRFGGVRDFIIGANFVDGSGTFIHGGGKVVKNAAGFDYPKLMVGSLGQLGVLVELNFKVFPKPEEYQTLRVKLPNIETAVTAMLKLMRAPLDVEALDIDCGAQPDSPALEVRVGGIPSSLPERMERIQTITGRGDVLRGDAEAQHWQQVREFGWAGETPITKIPLTPEKIAALDAALEASLVGQRVPRRYSVGGNVAFVAADLPDSDWPGLRLLGSGAPYQPQENAFTRRIKQALDPENKFV